jgi:hypothetical protein
LSASNAAHERLQNDVISHSVANLLTARG